MKLSAEHIKYGKPSQIAKLLGKKVPAVSRWNKKDFISGCLEIKYPCIEYKDLVSGLVCRKQRIEEINRYQQEFDEALKSFEIKQTA